MGILERKGERYPPRSRTNKGRYQEGERRRKALKNRVTETYSQREREGRRETEIERERDTERVTERQRERAIPKEAKRDKGRQRETERNIQTAIQTISEANNVLPNIVKDCHFPLFCLGGRLAPSLCGVGCHCLIGWVVAPPPRSSPEFVTCGPLCVTPPCVWMLFTLTLCWLCTFIVVLSCFVRLSVCLSGCPLACLLACLLYCLSVCLSSSLSVCLS